MSWSTNPETQEALASLIKKVIEVEEPAVRYNMALNYIASSYARYGSEPNFGSFACTMSMAAIYREDYVQDYLDSCEPDQDA
jgi:hypothetical protein